MVWPVRPRQGEWPPVGSESRSWSGAPGGRARPHLAGLPEARLPAPHRRRAARPAGADGAVTGDPREAIDDREVEAVVIVTPTAPTPR